MVPQEGYEETDVRKHEAENHKNNLHMYPALVTDTGDIYGTNHLRCQPCIDARALESNGTRDVTCTSTTNTCTLTNARVATQSLNSHHVTSLPGCYGDRTVYRSRDGKLYECPTVTQDANGCVQCNSDVASRYSIDCN